jgi:peptide deformylase
MTALLPHTTVHDPLPAGVARPAVSDTDPVLRLPGALVDPRDPDTVRLAADLVATMRASPGCVGIAAPQVGVSASVLAVDVSGHPLARTSHGTVVLCNARLIAASRWHKGREGCLSVPDRTGDVKRAGRVVVAGHLPGSGEDVELAAEGLEARAFQHEIDHCAGLLFLDRVAGAHAVHARRERPREVGHRAG